MIMQGLTRDEQIRTLALNAAVESAGTRRFKGDEEREPMCDAEDSEAIRERAEWFERYIRHGYFTNGS